MRETLKSISVVIPVFAREDVFETVAFLGEQPYADSLRIVVVDNGNASELAERLLGLAHPRCEVIRLEENRGGSGGYIAGVNHAMTHHSDTEFLWLLDDDAEPETETLPSLFRHFASLSERGEKIAGTGSAMLGKQNRDRVTEIGASINWRTGSFIPFQHGEMIDTVPPSPREVPYCAAASLLVTKEAIREQGFFVDVFIHYDDVEWCFRLRKAGWKFYAVPESRIRHPEPSGRSADWLLYYDIRNYLWFCGLYRPAARWLFLGKKALKGFYFRLHGARSTARLIHWGISDAFHDRVRLRRELPMPRYTPVNWEEINHSRRPILLICRSREDAEKIAEQLPDCRCSKIIYRTDKNKWLSLACAMTAQSFAQLRHWLWRRKELVIFDDVFRTNLMLPLMAKDKIFYDFSIAQGVQPEKLS